MWTMKTEESTPAQPLTVLAMTELKQTSLSMVSVCGVCLARNYVAMKLFFLLLFFVVCLERNFNC